MKLYHYVPKDNNVSKVGILSISRKPDELLKYAIRVGSCHSKDIQDWLEKTFVGRTRAVSVLTEPVEVKGTDPMLAEWVDAHSIVCIDGDRLFNSGLVESIWCKDGSDGGGQNETIYQIDQSQIKASPLSWHLCSKEKGLFFGVIRHYFLVMKDGVIPPEYCWVDKE